MTLTSERVLPETAPRRPVTLRAVLISLVSVALLCGITPYNDFKLGSTYIAGNLFPIGALAVMLLLVLGVNVVLWKSRPRSALSAGELLTVWAMITVASGIPSSGLMRYLIPHIVAPMYYATPENRWEDIFLKAAPQSLMITDKQAARWFFEGLPAWLPIPWKVWLTPLALWGILVLLLYLALFCIATILRKQWVEHERFSFPLIRLPVIVAQAPPEGRRLNDFLRSPLLWLAVAVVTAIHTLKGLHLYFPEVPDVTLLINADPLLEGNPWRFSRPFHMRIYPLVIGFAYFLSSEVCFSLWFFYLVYKLQLAIGGFFNWQMPGMGAGYGNHAFHSFEAAGGCLALFVWMLWVARPHLRQVWAAAFRRDRGPETGDGGTGRRGDGATPRAGEWESGGVGEGVNGGRGEWVNGSMGQRVNEGDGIDPLTHRLIDPPVHPFTRSPVHLPAVRYDQDEPLSYRTAVIGLMFAYAGIFAWQLWAGIGWVMGLAQIVIGTIILVVLAWLVCQAGLLFIQPTFSAAEVMVNSLGSTAFTSTSHFMTSQVDHVLLLDLREYVLPSLLNGQRAVDEARVRRRNLTLAMAAAIAVSLVVSGAAAIHLPYRNGGATALWNTWTYVHSPQISLRWAANMTSNVTDPSQVNLTHLFGGGMGVWGMLWLRSKYPTLGVHPAGFLIASGYPMYCLWFSFFLGWLFKGPIVRYGGLKGYTRLQPLFLGLVLGDCLNAALWIAIGFYTKVGYSVLPG